MYSQLSELGLSYKKPAESVYQTAIQIRLQRLPDQGKRWFYRGQRNCYWHTVPKLFRNMPPSDDPAFGPMLAQRINKVRGCAAALKELGISHDDFEATAVVQHYSSELDTSTWLLDVSASPWVSLFFASDGGEGDEIGSLEYLKEQNIGLMAKLLTFLTDFAVMSNGHRHRRYSQLQDRSDIDR